MSMSVEGLRGEASQVAMDIGTYELMRETGFAKLMEGMYKIAHPHVRHEVRDMYRLGHKRSGLSPRQPAGGMLSYVRRRKRWWTQLKASCPMIEMIPEILADMLLESSGLNENQQLMIFTLISNGWDLDLIVDALHPRVQPKKGSTEDGSRKHQDKPHHRKPFGGKGANGGRWTN